MWKIEDAQAALPRLIEDAVTIGPQTITREGSPLVVVVASNEWDEMLDKEDRDSASGHRRIDTIAPSSGHLKNFICG